MYKETGGSGGKWEEVRREKDATVAHPEVGGGGWRRVGRGGGVTGKGKER
jgi:hypothetical protein